METDPLKILALAAKAAAAAAEAIVLDGTNLNQRIIARYENDKSKLMVSTARVSDGFKPIETAISHPRYNGGKLMIAEAYETVEQAQLGHAKWVGYMNQEKLPELILDAINCVPAQCIVEAEGKLEYWRDETTP